MWETYSLQGLEGDNKATGEATLSGLSVSGNSRLDTASILQLPSVKLVRGGGAMGS